jgi:UDP-N-acetylmuramate dehydrogenase
MNAGAHRRSMSDVIERVEVYGLADQGRRSLSATEARFGYRRSSLPSDGIVVGAAVRLAPAEEVDIRSAMEEAREWRRRTQPLAEPNCGSVFKNPDGDHAARLIESSGAKGLRVGGARVSEKHSNFIVADPGASASDVWQLIERVRSRVESDSGIRLETEVELMGEVADEAG